MRVSQRVDRAQYLVFAPLFGWHQLAAQPLEMALWPNSPRFG